MNRLRPLILAASLLILAAACGRSTNQTFFQTNGEVAAELELSPFPPRSMEATELVLTLKNAQGEPLEDIPVVYDLTMPGMAMPENQPEPSYEGKGVYRTQAVFTMAGDWQITVRVDRAGRTTVLEFTTYVK